MPCNSSRCQEPPIWPLTRNTVPWWPSCWFPSVSCSIALKLSDHMWSRQSWTIMPSYTVSPRSCIRSLCAVPCSTVPSFLINKTTAPTTGFGAIKDFWRFSQTPKRGRNSQPRQRPRSRRRGRGRPRLKNRDGEKTWKIHVVPPMFSNDKTGRGQASQPRQRPRPRFGVCKNVWVFY